MKTNQLLKLCIVAVLMFQFISCQEKSKNKEHKTETRVKKPKQAISIKQAKVLQQEFIKSRASYLNRHLDATGQLKGQDVRDVWYSLQVMKDYIAYVEQEAKIKGYKDLGLRVYFGAYPKGSNYPNPGYSTVFFIPTYKTKKSAAAHFAAQTDDTNMKGVDGLNLGHGGVPPNDI